MKTTIVCFMALSLGAGAVSEAREVQLDVRVNSLDDTIYAAFTLAFEFWISSDVPISGFQIPITLSSPDGATWRWKSQHHYACGDSQFVTHEPDSRMADPEVIFEFTNGIDVKETYLPGLLFFGGVGWGSPGHQLPAGPLEHMLSAHFMAFASPGEIGMLCLDLTQSQWPREIAFVDVLGGGIPITFLDDNHDGVWCWPIVATRCGLCPGVTVHNDISMFHCETGTALFSTDDPLWNPLWEYEIIDGEGTVSLIPDAGITIMATYTPGPGEVSGTALVEIRVGYQCPPHPDWCQDHSYDMKVSIYYKGDANSDGSLNIGDAVSLINYVFKGGPAPDPLDAADVNCDGFTNVGDAVYMVIYVFGGGPEPCCR